MANQNQNYDRVETKITGTKLYYLNDQLHRTDGPAIEYADGYKSYYQNNKYHRTDGPAVEWADGYKAYYLNDKRHRTDGPAIEYANGDKEYWINGEQLTEREQFLVWLEEKKNAELR